MPTSRPVEPGVPAMPPKKHAHGHLYRAKIAPFSGPTEYSEWFPSESALRTAMRETARDIGKRYYCEEKLIACAQCEVDERPRVISTL